MPDVGRPDRLDSATRRRSARPRRRAQLARRVVGQFAGREDARPEAARRRRPRRAVGLRPTRASASSTDRTTRGRTAACFRCALAERADAVDQRLEPIGARRRVRHPQAERERAARRIELADDVVEIGAAALRRARAAAARSDRAASPFRATTLPTTATARRRPPRRHADDRLFSMCRLPRTRERRRVDRS